jgi:hypothetical protein
MSGERLDPRLGLDAGSGRGAAEDDRVVGSGAGAQAFDDADREAATVEVDADCGADVGDVEDGGMPSARAVAVAEHHEQAGHQADAIGTPASSVPA